MLMPPQSSRLSWHFTGRAVRPSRWHNRNYGLMVANPFGREATKQGTKSSVMVKRGETFRLCFGAAIHQGRVENPGAFYDAFRAHLPGLQTH